MSRLPNPNTAASTKAEPSCTVGRPSKLTAKTRARIVERIRAGNRRSVAARAAGVSDATFYRWMKDGRATYLKFRQEVEQAEAEFEADLVGVVVRGIPDEPKLAMRLLEARSGEWRRWKLPPEPEPTPEPAPESQKPATAIILSPEEISEFERRRIRVENGEPPDGPSEEVLAARRSLVTESTRR